MEEIVPSPGLVRFGTFEVDLRAGELRKAGVRQRLTGQPFQVLAILLECSGELVTREDLQKRLWPDTFVDVDHNLNTAINKIREVLGDSAESPRFVETLPRRGYRFIAPVARAGSVAPGSSVARQELRMPWVRRPVILLSILVLVAATGFFIYERSQTPAPSAQRTLTRVTFDEGLQIGVTWSPDSRFIAYSSNRAGKFDIWVQQLSGGDPVQITKGPGHNWQPDWSPDGKYIAYRTEDGEGGLYIVPALGGQERKIAAFGYYPHWSPDGSQILFQTTQIGNSSARFYVVTVDGSARHEVVSELTSHFPCLSAAWHPDGKRISVWVWDRSPTPIPSFWTAPIAGGPAVKSEIGAEVLRMGEAAAGEGFTRWADFDFKFSWAPSGSAIYFERTLRRAKNIWRISIDPQTLRATALERVTTGPGLDSELSLSPDGGKVAFSGEFRNVRAWLFPFDAVRGRVIGHGEAITSPGVEAWHPSLSRNGKKLAFDAIKGGKWELRETLLPDGQETRILGDDPYVRNCPQWSPDSTHLAYSRETIATAENQLMTWSSQSGEEEPLAAPTHALQLTFDWSHDGKLLLISQGNSNSQLNEIWRLSLADSPHAETSARRMVADPIYDLYQPHFSPNSKWIVFEGTRDSESNLYVMPAEGGPWIRISEGNHWDDKPRWSPDGKSIYFLSERGGFFNVWGIRFDSTKGKPVGHAFPVTSFSSPSQMIPTTIPTVEISLTRDKLVLTMEERSGSIWVLDNVGR